MHYVRVLNKTPAFNSCHGRDKAHPDIAKIAFDLDPNKEAEVSLYEVESEIDEVRVASAIVLRDKQSSSSERFVLRLDAEDINRSGLALDGDQFGETGIVDIDCLHWNIVCRDRDKESERFIALTELFRERIWRGECRIRQIHKSQIESCITCLQLAPDGLITPFARRNCAKYGGQKAAVGSRGEYRNTTPSIPHKRVVREAYRLWLAHKELFCRHDGDYECAAQRLAELYHDHYDMAFFT